MILAAIFGVILAELLYVGWIDFKTQKISNKWIIVNIAMSVLLHVIAPILYPLSWEILLLPLGFLFFGFLLFLVHVMGGGDSKFLASLFLIIPLEYHFIFFEKLVLSTMITGAALLLYRLLKHPREIRTYVYTRYWAGLKQLIKSRFSYAPVIVVAWVLLGLQIWA